MTKFCFNAAVGALVVGLMAGPAYALDVGVGGGLSDRGSSGSSDSGGSRSGGGGVSASATVGGKSAADAKARAGDAAKGRVTVGGRGNVASGKANVGGNEATVEIGKGSGPLVSGSQSGNPLAGASNTDVDVNLGGLKGVLGGGGGHGGGIDRDKAETALNSLSSNERAQVKTTCGAVLNSPQRFDAGMVQLCQLLVTL